MSNTYSKTGLAIFVALLPSVPSLIVGGLFTWFYKGFLKYMLVTLSWLPFYDIIETVSLNWFGGLLHGAITAAVAVSISAAIFKKANHQTVSHALSAVLLTLVIGAITLNVQAVSYELSLVESIAFAAGLPLGAFLPADK